MQAVGTRAAKRRYKGETCVYCATEASSEAPDHVFARSFFPVEERDGLPMVPACRSCNQDKAALENYVVTILPFGGESAASVKMLHEKVPGRLAQNLKLKRELAAGQSRIWLDRGGLTLPTLALPLDTDRFLSLFQFIARGLVAHHWNVIVPADYTARSGMFTARGEQQMRNIFTMRPAAVAKGRMGADTILYEGVQAFGDPCLTIWRFRMYGGLMLTGDDRREATSDVWATTSRPELPSFFDL